MPLRIHVSLYAQAEKIAKLAARDRRSREGHCAIGLRKITLQATLSVLTFQATVLAHLQAKDPEKMRRMSVKIG